VPARKKLLFELPASRQADDTLPDYARFELTGDCQLVAVLVDRRCPALISHISRAPVCAAILWIWGLSDLGDHGDYERLGAYGLQPNGSDEPRTTTPTAGIWPLEEMPSVKTGANLEMSVSTDFVEISQG